MSETSHRLMPSFSPINDHISISSFESSSIQEQCRLSDRDKRKLERLYEEISRGLLEERTRKVQCLEQYEQALSARGQVEHQMRRLEGQQLRRIRAEKTRQEALLLDLLTSKEKAKKKLREATDAYQKKHKIRDIGLDFANAEKYVGLVQERVLVEEEIKRMREEERRLVRENGGEGLQELEREVERLQREHRKSLDLEYKINVVQPKTVQVEVRELNCSQLRALIFKWSIQNQQQQIYSLLQGVKFPEQSYAEVESFILEEQGEKSELYEDLMKMKGKLQARQAENRRLEAVLAEDK